jgi:hypothetical protein
MFDLIDCLIDTLEFVSWTLVIVQEVFEYTKRDNQNPKIEEEQNTMAKRKSTTFFSRFICKHSDTYTSVTRGHFLNNIYIQDMTEWTYDDK